MKLRVEHLEVQQAAVVYEESDHRTHGLEELVETHEEPYILVRQVTSVVTNK